ncbi:MAG: HTTM domain-containing protein [Candidatus Xenobia bacterium]
MSLRDVAAGWNRFWFSPIAPVGIAMFRIAYGFLVLCFGALLSPNLLTLLGPRGIVSLSTAIATTPGPRIDVFRILPPTDTSVWLVFWTLMIGALCLCLGLFARASAVVVFVALTSMIHRNVYIYHSGDSLMRLLALYLIFSHAGDALSVDAWLKRRRHPEFVLQPQPPWAQRLIQVQLALVYFETFLAKAHGTTWVDGTAVYYTSRLQEFWRLPVPYLFEHMWTVHLITWGTLAVELGCALLFWFCETRYWMMAIGALFHLGLDWSMNVPLFEWTMLATYLTCIEPAHIQAALDGMRSVAAEYG